MTIRRILVVCLAALVACGLGALLLCVLAPGGWTLPKLIMLAAFVGTAPWTGLCAANGLIGFVLLMATRSATGPTLDTSRPPPTAIAMTVRNEDMRTVLPPLRRLLDDIDHWNSNASTSWLGLTQPSTSNGAETSKDVDADLRRHDDEGPAFALFILSDTQDPAAAAAEEQAVALFRASDMDPARIHYRRRATNAGFKAGNIMEFLDHHADGFELMLVLDADSVMSANAVMRMIRAMQTQPTLGIVQHLTVGLPANSAFPRLFQFGMRAGMRVWATGQCWWQGDEGPYWGHNALVRIEPFRAHCRLPLLPDGRHILSHDQLEAALLSGAGWGVRLLPEETGSAETNPPALPEFLRRELRWMAGSLDYRHLLRLPGLRPMGRWQLAQPILMFAGTPLYLLFLLAAAAAAATDDVSPFPTAPAAALTFAWLAALYAPKLLGYVEVVISPARRAAYGGLARFAIGMASEVMFTLLLDAVSAVAKTRAMLRLLFGGRAGWSPQNRTDRDVGWREATMLLWPQLLLGVAVFAAFATAGWTAVIWALPLAGGLLAAIPFCVLTAHPRAGDWLCRRGIAAIPEEFDPTSPSRKQGSRASSPNQRPWFLAFAKMTKGR